MANGRTAVYVDIRDLQSKINFLHDSMSQTRFENAMYGVVRDTSRHVKAILRKDIPIDYYFKSSEISKSVGSPEMGFGVGGGLKSCAIPIKGPRHSVGGYFKAKGGHKGWNPPKYRITANIVTERPGTLPESMAGYGDQPPFRNTAARKKGMRKVAFTREGDDRLPIRRVEGIAVPQAITNRSEEHIAEDTLDYMGNRLDHRITALLKFGR